MVHILTARPVPRIDRRFIAHPPGVAAAGPAQFTRSQSRGKFMLGKVDQNVMTPPALSAAPAGQAGVGNPDYL
ncbi:hypothetical protein GCM10023323_14270 [Streptomyces thinghirensis]|uniref:Uncharacterized protein n=1 Tax=Streptomyces thinghirensis TaxID=551547 RepID=A0ABP9SX67_9ACTN